MDDRDLLALQVRTIFVTTAAGRMRYRNTAERETAPRLYVAGSKAGNIVCLREDVGEETSGELARLAASEPPMDGWESSAVHLDEYVRFLGREAPVATVSAGLTWTFPRAPSPELTVQLILSGTSDGDCFLARLDRQGMPAEFRAMGFPDTSHFWAPWCAAFAGDEFASIAFTSGLSAVGAEIGVNTAPAFRGRGMGAAACAGWASHPALHGRTLFYGTDRTNVSSQKVAQRLGLRFIGARLSIT